MMEFKLSFAKTYKLILIVVGYFAHICVEKREKQRVCRCSWKNSSSF